MMFCAELLLLQAPFVIPKHSSYLGGGLSFLYSSSSVYGGGCMKLSIPTTIAPWFDDVGTSSLWMTSCVLDVRCSE